MRGIRLAPMGRYRATCVVCQTPLALTFHQKIAAEAGKVLHWCAEKRVVPWIEPPVEACTGRIVVLT